MSQEFLRTSSLSVGYGEKVIISDVDISIEKGQIVTLIGPNGAGKSTILKTIIGQLPAISGSAELGGEPIDKISRKEFAKKVSVLLTDRPNPELMTCEDVVAMGRYPHTGALGILNDDDQRIVDEAMDLIHVTELRDRDYMAISDGQRQRVMLARAICQEPELMILDEPTSFLDIRYKLELLSTLQELARTKGMTVLMSLHEIDLAERVSDKIACIGGGKVDRFGPPEEIFTGDYIKQLYGLTVGSYDEVLGRVELPAITGAPQYFVMAGNGTGTRLFRSLQRLGIPFATGVLAENDLDYPVACSLASEVVSVPAFHTADSAAIARVNELLDECPNVVCTLSREQLEENGLSSLIERMNLEEPSEQ